MPLVWLMVSPAVIWLIFDISIYLDSNQLPALPVVNLTFCQGSSGNCVGINGSALCNQCLFIAFREILYFLYQLFGEIMPAKTV